MSGTANDHTCWSRMKHRPNSRATKTIGPADQPWNAREFTVLDPDGYRLTFTQPINVNRSMDAVVDSVSQRNR